MDINDLKQQGYRVFVRHSRYFPGFETPMTRAEIEGKRLSWSNIESNGGETEVEIYSGDQLLGSGRARCSFKDNFCRRTGRKTAIDRALMNAIKPRKVSRR